MSGGAIKCVVNIGEALKSKRLKSTALEPSLSHIMQTLTLLVTYLHVVYPDSCDINVTKGS